ncbi:MAG: phospholipid carrier-dependent glycosyltransferase [Solirubrobacteraceae bacterium]
MRGPERHGLGAILRGHAPLVAVMAVGAAVRVLTQIAYGPALYYYDSFAYLAQANGGLFTNAAEPAGYPVAIRIFRRGTSDLGLLTGAQHLAGLAAGMLVYVVVLRLTGRKSLGVLGAAVVVLDGYAIAVEQYVMTDAFFGALLIASAALTLLARRRLTLAAGGIVLAAACIVRATGLLCVPVWLAYVLWRHRRASTVALCAAAVLLPLAGYAAANDAKTGHYTLTDDTAWLVYARIGAIGDCKGLVIPADERVLCPHGSQLRRSVNYYLEAPDSPAVRAFGFPSISAPPRADGLLLGYAVRVMSQRPLPYLGLVASSFLDFFIAAAPSESANENGAITLPKPGPWLWPTNHPRQRWPAGPLRAYVAVLHTVRPLLAVFLVLGVLALVLSPPANRPAPRAPRPAIALLIGMAIALLLGAALDHFELRYVLPAVPPLACGGMLAVGSLWERYGRVDGLGWKSWKPGGSLRRPDRLG